MKAVLRPLVAGAFALFAVLGAAVAQDATQLSGTQLVEAQGKVKLASGLIALGRADQDAMKLLVGAKILSDLGMSVADPAEDASTAFDVAAVLAEARTLAGEDEYLLDAIAAVPAVRTERGERYCGWAFQCGTFECDWVYSCNW